MISVFGAAGNFLGGLIAISVSILLTQRPICEFHARPARERGINNDDRYFPISPALSVASIVGRLRYRALQNGKCSGISDHQIAHTIAGI